MADVPKTVHRYEIVERLGQGGMGDLYLGRDPMLDRFVAIKMLKAGSTADDLRERFAREARSAARLAHVNIVTIYDVGEHAGQPYIAMEYVLGETLLEKIRRRSDLPLATKLQYVDELCAGLAHAHKAGIIHRDIKPANLIVSAEGALKILDFGIARLADSSMTQSGMMLGTLNYMSPEQISGPDVDHRSDIFAVGAVFYELLSYQQAFPGAIDTVLSRILFGAPVPLSQVCPGLDASIVGIVERALAKTPDERFADMTALRAALARARDQIDRSTLDAPVTTSRIAATRIPVATPTPAGRTPRRGTTREEIKRRRAEEVAAHLAAARNAFAEGKYEDASAACERALIIEQDNDEALDLSERARTAIEQNQIRAWASEARDQVAQGNLEGAQQLLSSIVAFDAESSEARGLQAAIAQLQARRLADKTVDDGRQSLDAGDAAAAAAAAREALRVNPTHAGAASLLRDASVLVETQRRRAEQDRQAREAASAARRTFESGAYDEAIAALEQFSPAHPDVEAALQELRAERQEIRDREWALSQQAAAEIVIAQAWLARDDLSEATAAVDRARLISPSAPGIADVAHAIEARKAEIEAKRRTEEEARRQAERARQRAEEEARRKGEEEARLRKEEEARRKAEEEAKRKAAEEAQRKAEAEARKKAEEAARRKAEKEARKKAADEARRRAAEEEQRRKAEEEQRRKAEEEARLAEQARAAEEARRAEEEAQRAQEARRRAEEDARRKAEEDARRKAEDEARRKAEEDARRKAEEEARRKAEEEKRRQAEQEARRKAEAEAEAKRVAAEAAQKKAEEEARQKAEEETRRKAEEAEAKARELIAAEQARRREEEARRREEEARRGEEDARRRESEARQRAEAEARRQADDAITQRLDLEPEPRGGKKKEAPSVDRPPQPVQPLPLVTPAATPRAGAGARQVLPLAAAGVVILILIGFGIWRFAGSDEQTVDNRTPAPAAPAQAPATAPSAPTTPAPAAPQPPPAVATGRLIIDAAPWAEVVEIVGASGPVQAPAGYTPLSLTVPAGYYRVTLRSPNDRAPRTVAATVAAGQDARAFAQFAPVDVDAYFRRAGQ